MNTTASELLRVNQLSVSVVDDEGLRDVVKHLQFSIEQGETFALVGESGSGKSMTAQALLRLLPDAAFIRTGQVRFSGDEVLALTERQMRQIRGAKASMIFQEPATSLNPVMTIAKQLAEVLLLHTDYRGAELEARMVWWLEKVGIEHAEQRLQNYPFQFSGGQKQRIMIAMALAAEPVLLIADEPTTALDVTVQAQILDLLRELQEELGLAILLITHDLAVVKHIAHRVALMRNGEIVEMATAAHFFEQPTHPYAQELLAAVPTFEKRGTMLSVGASASSMKGPHSTNGACEDSPQRTSCSGASQDGRQGQGVAAVVKAQVDNQVSLHPTPTRVLTINNLQVGYKAGGGILRRKTLIPVVQNLSLQLHAGETLALLGASGCGKSTVAKALMRLLDQQAVVDGNVDLLGQDVLKAKGAQLRDVRRTMQIVFQDPFASLNPRMVVGDILLEGVRTLQRHIGKNDAQQQVQRLLDQTALPSNSLQRYPHEFSGGQRQRIAIARALAVQPKVLICDEPTSALDVSVQAQILDLLTQLQQETQMAYLFITHNFSVVEYLADTIAIMDEGRIVEKGTAEQVLFGATHSQTQALLASVPRL